MGLAHWCACAWARACWCRHGLVRGRVGAGLHRGRTVWQSGWQVGAGGLASGAGCRCRLHRCSWQAAAWARASGWQRRRGQRHAGRCRHGRWVLAHAAGRLWAWAAGVPPGLWVLGAACLAAGLWAQLWAARRRLWSASAQSAAAALAAALMLAVGLTGAGIGGRRRRASCCWQAALTAAATKRSVGGAISYRHGGRRNPQAANVGGGIWVSGAQGATGLRTAAHTGR